MHAHVWGMCVSMCLGVYNNVSSGQQAKLILCTNDSLPSIGTFENLRE